MDPNANLKEIRAILAEAQKGISPNAADRLVELVEALDGWLTGGGFLPQPWNHARLLSGKEGV